MAKNGFEKACDIITLISGVVTLGCLAGIKKLDKEKEKHNKSNESNNKDSDSSE